mmetsp:Transcript_9048/g.22549  ORF Transcript_9048/g.22549 Transcript_9048/m.22549 type:complete len:203 (+) Transcript_9048:2162-2770(+)
MMILQMPHQLPSSVIHCLLKVMGLLQCRVIKKFTTRMPMRTVMPLAAQEGKAMAIHPLHMTRHTLLQLTTENTMIKMQTMIRTEAIRRAPPSARGMTSRSSKCMTTSRNIRSSNLPLLIPSTSRTLLNLLSTVQASSRLTSIQLGQAPPSPAGHLNRRALTTVTAALLRCPLRNQLAAAVPGSPPSRKTKKIRRRRPGATRC